MTGRSSLRFLHALALGVTALALSAGTALAAGAAAPKAPPPIPPQEVRIVDEGTGEPKVDEKPLSEVENYCLNIADKAQDARHALQTKELKSLESQIGEKITELETRRAEYQKWTEERKAFLEDASSVVVDIYSSMKADAAAPQLAQLGHENAAMILVRLKPRQASSVLSEMSPEDAAAIAKLIVEKTSNDTKTEDATTVAQGQS
ncbi:flagellar protein [Fulvimarina endophytica]|uniref:Flagellar protein n=1 Tax=Fulvimarina endophytica TaxID=2293836 RepID=A0A371X4C0_9HYPH|nr:MotE family protein [Fulvimarina endophytica]RFC64081.1 flagellar protein [Fulvimarina endophytica]